MAFQRMGEAAFAQIFQRDYSETCLLQGKPSAFAIWLSNQHSSNAGDAVSLFLLIFSHAAQFIDANAPPLFPCAAPGPPRMLKSNHWHWAPPVLQR